MVVRRNYQYPRRPPRLERHFASIRPFYFVTFNTYRRRSLLARHELHHTFCNFCIRAQEHAVAVGRYVIMRDHVHLFVAFPPDGITLDQWVQALRTVLGKELLVVGTMKPHWQEGFLITFLGAGGKLFAEVGVRPNESGAGAIVRQARRLAFSGRNFAIAF